MVIGTFALFWKQTLKPFFIFSYFFLTSLNSLIRLKLDIALTGTWEKYFLFARWFDIFFTVFFYFVTSVQEYFFFFPIHINCHNNTKDIKKKPPHLLSFCDCEKVPLRGRVPIMHLVRWFMLLFSRFGWQNTSRQCKSQLHQFYSRFL